MYKFIILKKCIFCMRISFTFTNSVDLHNTAFHLCLHSLTNTVKGVPEYKGLIKPSCH